MKSAHLKLPVYPRVLARSQYPAKLSRLQGHLGKLLHAPNPLLVKSLGCSKVRTVLCQRHQAPALLCRRWSIPTRRSGRNKASEKLELELSLWAVSLSPLQVHLSPLGSPPGATLDGIRCSSSVPRPQFIVHGPSFLRGWSCDLPSAPHQVRCGVENDA